MKLWEKFFVVEDDDGIADANSVLGWAGMDFTRTLMAYLDRECDEPIKARSEESMREQVIRQNTYKEFRAYIRKQVDGAQRILAEARSE